MDTTQLQSLPEGSLPGMVNLHSHAFQRAMAGLAERRGPGADSFWTWREVMYAFAAKVAPEDLEAIATQLYVEMLKAGYTHVCEFHYLHHQPDGRPYADPAAMSAAIVRAATHAGIGLTLLPVLYMAGDFDGRALNARQQRFAHEVPAFLRLLESLREAHGAHCKVGVAFHSLRAVPAEAMRLVLDSGLVKHCPIHVHVAEQVAEVDACLQWLGARPVEWLLGEMPIDARWCMVHATHMTETETHQLARSGAVAGLCPTTEANLGDGLFPLQAYLENEGVLGIGSDSHVSVSPVEELRWLEYGQRLGTRRRAVVPRKPGDSSGRTLWDLAIRGGRQAAGLDADDGTGLLELDMNHPLLVARQDDEVLDSFLFAGNSPLVRNVYVGGQQPVRDFHHAGELRIAERFRATMRKLAQA